MVALLVIICPIGSVFAQQDESPPDLMSFARGLLPLLIDTGDAPLKVNITAAISAIDGNSGGYAVTQKPGTAEDVVEITYALPALTMFNRFAVPNVFETPSPSQTFFKNVEILGSSASAEGPYIPLASGQLETNTEPDIETELILASEQTEVRWIKVRLWDGINVEREKTFFEFSELVGNGTQREPALSKHFNGVWKGRGVKIELAQKAATVTGCYDASGKLAGTVSGNVLRALGSDTAEIPSQFILIATEDGALRGLRSTNGAPFKPYDGETSTKSPVCLSPEPPALGCGSVVHGIGFDFDSDNIRPSSEPIIQSLFEGLSNNGGTKIEIIGHSSSEGQAEYNRDLSQRRAQSVVSALVALGLEASQLSATGSGEEDPIASNDDEAGRSLNRRVEIQCGG